MWLRVFLCVTMAMFMLTTVSHGEANAENARSGSGESVEVTKRYYELLNIALNGDSDAKVELFLYTYEHIDTLRQNISTALEHLVEAVELENKDATRQLALLLDEGSLVEEDKEKAFILMIFSAQLGNSDSMYWCLVEFSERFRAGTKTEERGDPYKNAEHWFEKIIESEEAETILKREAKFVFSTLALYRSVQDAEAWALLGEAAMAGHAESIKIVRGLYADAQQHAYADDLDRNVALKLMQPIIEVIGSEALEPGT